MLGDRLPAVIDIPPPSAGTSWPVVCQSLQAPRYLTDVIQRVADFDRATPASATALLVLVTSHPSIGGAAIPIAAARIWISLPKRVTSAPNINTSFRRRLEAFLWNVGDQPEDRIVVLSCNSTHCITVVNNKI